MFESNRDYNVCVRSAYLIESQVKHTPGIELSLEHEDHGTITHTLWLTPKTVEGVRNALAAMGIDEATFSRPSFLENCNNHLAGAQCSINTFEEEYNGKRRVKVQWINPPVTPSAGGPAQLAKRAAALLSGKPAANDHAIELDSSDIPF